MKKLFLSLLMLNVSMFAMAQIYVNNSGNVGIGTESPTTKFEIAAPDGNSITFKPSNNGSIEIGGGKKIYAKHENYFLAYFIGI